MQMLFNFGKCKCLHIGPENVGKNHEMEGTIYTILLLKSVGVTKLPVEILARSSREIYQTVRID